MAIMEVGCPLCGRDDWACEETWEGVAVCVDCFRMMKTLKSGLLHKSSLEDQARKTLKKIGLKFSRVKKSQATKELDAKIAKALRHAEICLLEEVDDSPSS